MESFDMMIMNTRLPPRKRLLAGFLRESSYCEFLPPIPDISGELGARIREVMNLPNSTLDEIIEVAESVASEAAQIAAEAKRKAMEKADVAVKARTAAKSALELLESVSPSRRSNECYQAKTKFRKKLVPIKLFYKTSRRAGSQETDEELARRLHHAMNSSPRISSNKRKKNDNSVNEVISNSGLLCIINSSASLSESNEQFLEKFDEKIAICSKAEIFTEDDEESTRYLKGRKNGTSLDRITVSSRKPKNRRKKRPLSHFNTTNKQEHKILLDCSDNLVDKELNPECGERIVPMEDVPSSIDDDEATKKISSVWKCKKMKMSHSSPDSKFLHALC